MGNTIVRETGRGLIINEGKVILMERWRDGLHYFSIPGGGVEAGETPVEATRRELHEELGVEVRVGRKLYEMRTDDRVHHIYLCEYISGEPRLQDHAPEAIEHANGKNLFKPGWVPVTELSSIPLIYWEPLRKYLIQDLEQGFDVDTKTITV